MAHWLEKVIALLKAETADLRELAYLAGGDPKVFYKGIDLHQLDTEGQNLEGMEFSPTASGSTADFPSLGPVGEIAFGIKRAKRQEERVAMILAELLKDRNRGREIISQYTKDKAAGANGAIEVLSDILRDEESGKEWSNLRIARKVSGVFRRSEDKRPILTYYLAKYLHTYPEICSWLKEKSVQKLSKDQQREFIQWVGERSMVWPSRRR
jgi:hypothetical protein